MASKHLKRGSISHIIREMHIKTMRLSPHTSQNAHHQKKSTKSKCCRVWRKGTLPHWWEYKPIQPLWKTARRFLKTLGIKNTRNKITVWPSNPTTGPLLPPWENHSARIHMWPSFTAALLATARTRKQPRCLPTREWIRSCGAPPQWSTAQP